MLAPLPPRLRAACSALAFVLTLTGCDSVVAPPEATSPPVGAQASLETLGAESIGVETLRRRAPEADDVIPGRYIVTLKRPAGNSAASRRAAAARAAAADFAAAGARIIHSFETALLGVAIEADARAVARIAADARVAFIEPDRIVRKAGSGSQTGPTWGLDRVDDRSGLDGSYEWATSGQGVTVYVLDTGIRTSHAEFGGRASVGFDTFGGDGQDCDGHGTHVAGTVGGATYGVAKDAALVAVRVLDCNGSGTTSGVIAGVDWVAANAAGPSVANMSLGGGASAALDNAVRNAIAAGVTFVLAAGNDNTDACTRSPARTAEAITVGSTTSSDARSSFSNYGACVDLFAPGSSITSAWYTSNTAAATISGTSMAAPHAAGAAALYLEANPGASPQTVRDALYGAATRGVVTGAQSANNHLLYSLVAGGTTPPPPPSNQAPTAAFSVACTYLDCQFTDGSADADGSVVARSWSFGDGGGSSATNPGHTFGAAGTYTVELTATDDDGATGTAAQEVTVTAPPVPEDLALSSRSWKFWWYSIVELRWEHATTLNVDVYLNGQHSATTRNDGFQRYNLGWGASGSYTFQVCDAGTSNCSNSVTVSF